MPTAPPLHPSPIYPGHPDYDALLAWPFPTTPFYAAQVLNVLRNDIPQRMLFETCIVWLYRDGGGNAVGFGTLAVTQEYPQFTNGLRHVYIPVLGVHPDFGGKGYGESIVNHLFSEAVLFYRDPSLFRNPS